MNRATKPAAAAEPVPLLTPAETLPARYAPGSTAIAAAEMGVAPVLHILTTAIERGVPVEAIERLATLYREEQDRAAARQFAAALAHFQQECPPIQKNATTKETRKTTGTGFDFHYAPLDTIAETVAPHLHKHGFSYSWDTETDEKRLVCTCTLRHANGHSVSAKFSCPTDSNLPVGSQQRFGAALTYARRYSLVQVLGLTTTDADTDAQDPAGLQAISAEQVATLRALLTEKNADQAKFLAYMSVEKLEDIHVVAYRFGLQALERMKAQPKQARP